MELYFLDACLLLLLVLAFYKGAKGGLLNRGIWLASLIAAYVAASKLCFHVTKLVDVIIYNERLTLALWFAALFLLTVSATRRLGKWLTRAINFTPIGWLNTLLGGLLNSLLYVAALTVVVHMGLIIIPGLDKYLEKTLILGQLVRIEKHIMHSRLAMTVFNAAGDIGN
ncbi:MAG: CvpA family protein [Candidatus Zixiibacteriota bacterium]